jgi:hypothetical protein
MFIYTLAECQLQTSNSIFAKQFVFFKLTWNGHETCSIVLVDGEDNFYQLFTNNCLPLNKVSTPCCLVFYISVINL